MIKDNVKLFWSSENITSKSTSAGLFVLIADNFLKIHENSTVYGCALVENQVKHIAIKNRKDLFRLQGSKYVQSNLTHVFLNVKEDLENGKNVLFSGTACQISAIKAYLKQDYQNLMTIDIVCHGVPSPEFFDYYLSYLTQKYKGEIQDFRFRNKSKTNRHGYIISFSVNGKKKNIYPNEDVYYNAFLEVNSLRPSCYKCRYANKKRVSDISIGDSNNSLFHKNEAISLAIINSAKGNDLFKLVQQNGEIKDTQYSIESASNRQLSQAAKKPRNRDVFYKILRNMGVEYVAPACSIKSRVLIRVKNSIPTVIKNEAKELLKMIR